MHFPAIETSRALKWLVASTLAIASLSCREVSGPPGPGPAPTLLDVRSLLVWSDSAAAGNVRPTFDDEAVYHMDFLHRVSAFNKNAGGLRWTITLPVTDPSQSGTGLLVAGGVLVAGDRDLFGLDRNSGAILWSYVPSVGISPGFLQQATDGTTVYCGSVSGHVYAVDGRTGQERWAASVAESATARVGVYNPVLREGIVYVGYTANEPVGAHSGTAAVSASDGRVLWVTPMPTPTPGNVSAALTGVAVTDRHVVAPSGDGSVVVLSRVTGQIERVLPRMLLDPLPPAPGIELRSIVAVGDNIIVSSNNGYIASLRVDDFSLRWRTNYARGSAVSVAADDQYAYITHAGGQVVTARLTDGVPVWILQQGTFRADRLEQIIASPAIDGDVLYFGGGSEVYAVRRH